MSYDEQRISDLIDGGLHQQKQEFIKYLEDNLIVGAKIKIGKKYSKDCHNRFKEGEVIELVNGSFECENGLYSTIENAPSIWDEKQNDFDSIYHLFGNEFEYFLDCEVVK